MRTSDLDECPELAQALLIIRARGMYLRAIEAPNGGFLVRCAPADQITDDVRRGLRQHSDLVRHLLAGWGDSYGLGLLFLLWGSALPNCPFSLHRGTVVVDGARFLRELRRVATRGPNHPRARTGSFNEDVASLAAIYAAMPRSSAA